MKVPDEDVARVEQMARRDEPPDSVMACRQCESETLSMWSWRVDLDAKIPQGFLFCAECGTPVAAVMRLWPISTELPDDGSSYQQINVTKGTH